MRKLLAAASLASTCLLSPALASSLEPAAESAPVAADNSLLSSGELCGGPDCGDRTFDCCDMFNGRQRFLGMLPSDHCFDNFISPISNPFFFEDPRSLTEVRGVFLENHLPNNLGGADFQVYAAQFRGRLTDRWSVIAPRLGYFQVNQVDSPAGLLSTPIGVKYNAIRDVDRQLLVSLGATYFIPGSQGAFANFGSGDFHLFLTGGKQIFDWGHWLSATGFRLPADPNWGTQFWYWSNQWDYQLPGGWYPLVGVNWYHWMRSAGLDLTGAPTGLDILNLPVGNVAGNNVVTSVAGLKWKPNGNFEVGGGFEFPLTDRTDVLRNRAYFDVIFRY